MDKLSFDNGFIVSAPTNSSMLSSNAFANCAYNCFDYRFPDKIKTLGQGVFKQDWRIVSGDLDFSNFSIFKKLAFYQLKI